MPKWSDKNVPRPKETHFADWKGILRGSPVSRKGILARKRHPEFLGYHQQSLQNRGHGSE